MTSFDYTGILTQAVDELSDSQSYKGLFHQHKDGDPLPSAKSLYKIVELARSILFPGYFGNSTINSHTITYHIGVNVENLFDLLTDQIQAGLCFGQENNNNENTISASIPFILRASCTGRAVLSSSSIINTLLTLASSLWCYKNVKFSTIFIMRIDINNAIEYF